jgi:hypothetical protein
MLNSYSRLYRVTTRDTDLYRSRGYRYADNAAKLSELLKKLEAKKVEVHSIEVKTETLTGNIHYTALHEIDLAATLASVKEG